MTKSDGRGGSMGKWLEGCEICNVGLVSEVNKLKESGISERAACRVLSKTAEEKFKTPMWSEKVILDRYRYHIGFDKKKPVSEFPTKPAKKYSDNKPLPVTTKKKPPTEIEKAERVLGDLSA